MKNLIDIIDTEGEPNILQTMKFKNKKLTLLQQRQIRDWFPVMDTLSLSKKMNVNYHTILGFAARNGLRKGDVKELLKKVAPRQVVTCKDVVELISELMSISREEIFSPSRTNNIIMARNMCYIVSRRELGLTYKNIIDECGKPESTIYASYKRTHKRIFEEGCYRDLYKACLSAIRK